MYSISIKFHLRNLIIKVVSILEANRRRNRPAVPLHMQELYFMTIFAISQVNAYDGCVRVGNVIKYNL